MRIPRLAVAPCSALALGLLLLAAPARAGVPSPPNCTVQTALVGSWDGGGIPVCLTPCGAIHPQLFQVVVRDANNLPVTGDFVKVIFPATGPRPHLAQNPGVQTVCPIELAFPTDASGTALVNLRFAGSNDVAAVGIYCQGVLLASVPARSPDYNGDGRVDLADFAVFAADYLDPLAGHPRSDFDNCPSTKLPDFSYFTGQYLASQGQPPAALCP